MLLAYLLPQPARRSTADDRTKQTRRIAVVAECVRPGRCDHKVRLFEFTFLFDQDRCGWSRLTGIDSLRPQSGATLATIKRTSNQIDQTRVIHVSGRGDDEIGIRKLARVKADGDLVVKGRNG